MLIPISFFVSTKFLLGSCFVGFSGFSSALGCGQLPQGEVTAMTFTASGFTLSQEMVYSEVPAVQNLITSISRSRDAAIKLISDLIMNAITDVLQEQGRNALLTDAVISLILQKLNVSIEYTPLNCPSATNKENNAGNLAEARGCFIIDGSVVSLCTINDKVNMICKVMPVEHVEPIPLVHRTVKGILRTSNAIMANWTRQMWQSVMNRVYQKLLTGRFEKYFSTAVVNVNN